MEVKRTKLSRLGVVQQGVQTLSMELRARDGFVRVFEFWRNLMTIPPGTLSTLALLVWYAFLALQVRTVAGVAAAAHVVFISLLAAPAQRRPLG